MTVSIIICTRNKADSLKLTVESIGKAILPAEWDAELLIVDNGSTDSTETAAAAMALPGMPIRYVQEPRKGKGYAYNAGMAVARGRVFLFTDDGVRVPVDWIGGMCRPILDGKADAVAGGVAFPPDLAATLARPPFSSLRDWFASTDGLDRNSPGMMVGANMAFHRHVLDQVPGFDVELGPGALGFYEGNLFSWQLLAAGYSIVGALDVVAEHHFDPARLTKEGLTDTGRKLGRSHAFVWYHWAHKKSRLVVPRLVLSLLRRYWVRCSNRISGNAGCGISVSGLRVEAQLAFYREYIAQRRRRHKYTLRGLAPQAK